ncbi:MAG: ABC transporter ATP-binding protein [Gammaproteobacteria bacterium]|nr:ABC transporter ATP-binding protein [Gammaproteobacteria bacterium]
MDEKETPSARSEYAVHTSKLCRVFGNLRAVEELDLRVESGTLYGFLGRNGAGKSTTIKMLTGILAPSSGSISLLGANPSNEAEAAEVRRRIGVVPEDLALFELLTGREYLDFVGTIYLLDDAVARERVDELFEVLIVGAEEMQLLLDYSHGMRKKLALAAALIGDPSLLFLDEPFEGVDAVSSRVMRDILVRFVDRGGTVFITSHVLDVIERLCTHVGIIDRGRLVYEAPLSSLAGRTLESVFIERVGDTDGMRGDLRWLREDGV